MKLVSLIASIVFVIGCCDMSYAQQSNRVTAERFGDHLWYGGNIGIGFQSFNNSSSFFFGVFPMVGYKITQDFSVGPRIGILYQYLRIRGLDTRIYNFHPIELSGGIFARYKFTNQIFAHTEFEVVNERRFTFTQTGAATTFNELEQNIYFGLGYSSGGKNAYEFCFSTISWRIRIYWRIQSLFEVGLPISFDCNCQ